jgi:hypothetical protein
VQPLLAGDRVPAAEARRRINMIVIEIDAKGADLARGLNINDAQLNRMRHKKTGFYRPETLRPINRLQEILGPGRKDFDPSGPSQVVHDAEPEAGRSAAFDVPSER